MYRTNENYIKIKLKVPTHDDTTNKEQRPYVRPIIPCADRICPDRPVQQLPSVVGNPAPNIF